MFTVRIFTGVHPEGRYLAPQGTYARPYVYPTREAAICARNDAWAGMACAGVDTTWFTHLIEEAK